MDKMFAAAYKALEIFTKEGIEAYIVGGATRNSLLGIEVKDIDITTIAPPVTTKKIFANYPMYTVGEKLGTVVVSIEGIKIDITTFRSDVSYIDHRHPKEIIFSDNLKEDLKRRDFTINALCLDINGRVIDEFNGIDDLNNHIIKTIGSPDARFYEDALRILRALRFKAKLDFKIEENTRISMFKNKHLLTYISNERKKDELLNILSGQNTKDTINEYLAIFNVFIPFRETDDTIDRFSNEYYKLAYLLNNCKGYNLKELKFSNDEIKLLHILIEAANINIDDDYSLVRLFSSGYKDVVKFLSELYQRDFEIRFNVLRPYILKEDELFLNGNDLMLLGYSGKEIGTIKKELVDKVRRKELVNDKESLLKYLGAK